MTKQELKDLFSYGHLVTAADMANLIDSFKSVQSPVTDPSAVGQSVTFIATISQDAEGNITVTKKSVNFSGYQTVAGMSAYQTVAGMSTYQIGDKQQVGRITARAGDVEVIEHNMKHYPTVRLINSSNVEINPALVRVRHLDINSVEVTLDSTLTDTYNYILD